MKNIILSLLFVIEISSLGYSQNNNTIKLSLDFPILDFPYQSTASNTAGNLLRSFANPSMNQSLQISTDLYSSINYGVNKLVDVKNKNKLNFILKQVTAGALDYMLSTLPFGLAWNHEEFHRAVLTKNGITSYNEVYDINLFSPVIFVSNVSDEDLIYLNNNHNSDFRRLMSAGSESAIAQVQLMQKNNFYNNSQLPNMIFYLQSIIGNSLYIKSSSAIKTNEIVEKEKLNKTTDIASRDFAGPDFTAWAYALFNPDSLYEARGIHPSGVGIDRALAPNQLKDKTKDYLNKQGNLSFLNMLSPHIFGFNKFKIYSNKKGNYYGNIALRHTLTPFGNDISLDLFFQTPSLKLFGAIHNYNNYKNNFVGLEGGIIDKEIWNNKILLSGTAMIWLQPENQSFYTKKSTLGGMLKAKAFYSFKTLKPYVEVTAKTKGWVNTNVYLEDKLGVNFGMRLDF